MTFKTLILILVILCLLFSLSCLYQSDEQKKITWVGCPVVSDGNKHTPRTAWISSIEIGLHPNGSMVWRERK